MSCIFGQKQKKNENDFVFLPKNENNIFDIFSAEA